MKTKGIEEELTKQSSHHNQNSHALCRKSSSCRSGGREFQVSCTAHNKPILFQHLQRSVCQRSALTSKMAFMRILTCSRSSTKRYHLLFQPSNCCRVEPTLRVKPIRIWEIVLIAMLLPIAHSNLSTSRDKITMKDSTRLRCHPR